MMNSTAWSVPDHPMHSTDDDFQQFLDINGMGNLADSLSYDFHDFQAATGAHLLQSPREQLDTPMSGSDAPIALSRTDPVLQHQMPAMLTAAPYQAVPATMMPPPTPSEAIVSSIDAQIQFLQQQKMQHQQRHLEEQQVAFFARQQNRMVPPTPQSLELPARTNHYYARPGSAERQQQQQQQAVDYRYQRSKDQHEVGHGAVRRSDAGALTFRAIGCVYPIGIAGSDAARDAFPGRYPVHCPGGILQPPDITCTACTE